MPCIIRKYDNLEKDFHDFLKSYDPMYKVEIIKINISSSFFARTRCKKCGGKPVSYYYVRKPLLYKDVNKQLKSSKWLREIIERMTLDWYLESSPKEFLNIKEFSFAIDDNYYVPAVHRTHRDAKFKTNVIEFVGCSCNHTVWALNQKSTRDRPEIVNRKSRYCYPNRFEY